jgi:predicted nucleotidyltransferase
VILRHNKLPNNISELIPDAADYLERRDDVIFAYLFGGLAKGDPKPLSDVDIAAYLSINVDFAHEKAEILEDLVDILHTGEIDLVVLNQSSLLLSMNVIKHNRVLVDKNPFVRHAFQSLIMRKYFDHHQFESAILRRRFYHG